ncbi:hypothetical protein SH528x_005592 [Novipirellula sp. SH528]|uniref:hypothetical protein n=1 Tax=Novipirellula sp. SH528 TaxID=3454466 RepID=UPI003FA157D1
MSWPVDEVLSAETDEPVEFDAVPCEWEESDLDEYLDVSILLHGVKGDKVALERVDGQLVCHVRFIVPNDFSVENQEKLIDEVTGALSDGFGENGLQTQGHNVCLELDLDNEPKTSTTPGPTVLPTLAALAFGGSADALREAIDAAKAIRGLESAMLSTLETMKPLSLAVGSGDVEKVQLLLDAGANPNGDDAGVPIESTVLVNSQCLSDADAVDMARRLVAAGASVKNPKGLAKKAASRGKTKLAEYFRALEQ